MINKKLAQIRALLIPAGSTTIVEAQLKLFYLMLGANIFKGGIYLFDAYHNHQGDGSGRALRLIFGSIILMVALRLFPKYLKAGIIWAISATVLHVYYRVFNQHVGVDTVAMQAIVMVIISSFYGLNARWGIVFTLIACAAPLLCHYIPYRSTALAQLPQGLNDIYIAINFLVILMSHVYFHQVLFGTLGAKEQLNLELKQLADSKSAFLSTMAHELRTPLNAVIGIADLLAQSNKIEEEKEQVAMLKFSADSLLALINNILDMNKLESGKLELDNAPFDCGLLLRSVCASMEPQVKKKSLQLHLQVDPLLKGAVYESDTTRLSQILFNLIGNAVKFTNKGSVTIDLLLLVADGEGDLIRFKISDTGIGISAQEQRVIFDPYMQASANTTRKFGGTGLGLSIVKQLIEMFGSEIQLDSTPGVGTTIYFDLKLKRSARRLQASDAPAEASDGNFSDLKVLLAEDNLMNVYFMRQVFKRWNMVADVVENGEQAIQQLLKKEYDLVLMDLNMPVMNGLDATAAIRALREPAKSTVYIIALTGEVSEDIMDKIKLAGMDDYLPKPFKLELLQEKLTGLAQRVLPGAVSGGAAR